MPLPHEQVWEEIRSRARQQVKALFNIEDTRGIELFDTLHRIALLSETMDCQSCVDQELTGPRWRLMLRLLIEEQLGNEDGLTPTILSHAQRVSKNTISALLRGLEEQGLIQRNLDPADLRHFRIQLSNAGRELILSTAPRRIEGLNRLLSSLSSDELTQLTVLLEKLHRSLLIQLHSPDKNQNNRIVDTKIMASP